MTLLKTDQVWAQKKGHVRVKITWFCKATQCPVQDPDRHVAAVRFQDHVHVKGWHGTTLVRTNHSVISVKNLLKDWRLEVPA